MRCRVPSPIIKHQRRNNVPRHQTDQQDGQQRHRQANSQVLIQGPGGAELEGVLNGLNCSESCQKGPARNG